MASCPMPGLPTRRPTGDAHRVAAGAIENLRRDQFVVEHDVGVLQRAQRLDREQIRIARPRADQRDAAFDSPGTRAGISGGSTIVFSESSASSQRPARTGAPIGPSTTRSQKRRRNGNSGMRP